MGLLRGEEIIVGVGIEAERGTEADIQAWVPARTPTGLAPVVDKVDVKETRGTRIASNGSEVVQKRVEGDIEANVRVQSIGYFLLSLLGAVSSALKGGESVVYQHTISVDTETPQNPSLTLGLHQGSFGDLKNLLAVVSESSFEISPDDLVRATHSIIAASDADKSPAYSPSFSADDVLFRHNDIVIKVAANVAGLSGANPLKVKDFKLDVPNNARPDQNVSELNPGDVIGLVLEPKGSFELNLSDDTFRDAYEAGTYKAVQISMTRSDITIGSASHPSLTITLPKVSFSKWTPNRPIDDITTESVDFTAHYDDTEEYAIEAVLVNKIASYEAES